MQREALAGKAIGVLVVDAGRAPPPPRLGSGKRNEQGDLRDMRIGWIGLGRMGRRMVENLVRKGFDVAVQNRSKDKVRELVAMGAKAGGPIPEMGALTRRHPHLPAGRGDRPAVYRRQERRAETPQGRADHC